MTASLTPLRGLVLGILSLSSAACATGKVEIGDDTAAQGGESGTTPPPDACDTAAGQILCDGNAALTCDASGDIAQTTACASGDSADALCYAGVGCLSCAPALSVSFADPATLASPGVAISVNPNTVDADTWGWQRLLMRPMVVSTAEALPGGTVTLSADTDGLTLYSEDGTELALPAVLNAASLPLTLLVNATARGTVALTATTAGDAGSCAEGATAVFRAGVAPVLSGRPRAEAPGWETAQTFHDVEPVYAALDATRFADRVGLPYDLYVVVHKSAEEWAADPSLVDVSGGAETATVSPEGIAANTTAVWATGLDAGLGVGAAYDLVMDFGQDGALDPGDLLDAGWATTGDVDADLAGFYILGDLSASGPHDVAQFDVDGGTWLGERVYYPSDIAAMGALPLVVISHGNGHLYTWYDYLGEHLASWGYIAMAHENNTGPGIETASTTTLTNTDYFLENADTFDGGELAGHVDGHRIAWIGHSRGGEGVVRAYDRLEDGIYTPDAFTADDIVAIISIAPTVFNSVDESDPHAIPYGLIAGTADGDVTGGVDCPLCDFFRISEAALGPVQTAYVVGADHNDFNCCGFDDADGPDLIGREEAQTVAKAFFLAMLQTYVDGNPATRDELARMYASFHAPGIADTTVVARTFRDAHALGYPIIDDLQTGSDDDISSSGGAVTFTVTDLMEGKLDDGDGEMGWTDLDPMNGMTHAALGRDAARGVVFDWDSGASADYTLDVVADQADFTGYGYLSFAVAQGSRNPLTDELGTDLDFTVTLVDAAGVESAINFGDQGRAPTPYPRTGLGAGAGWANEFVTVRIPLADFALGTDLDLSQISAVRFDFGESFGSSVGRVGLDNVELSR